MRVLLVGYGKMGRLVGELAQEYDCTVAGIVDPVSTSHTAGIDDPRWQDVDVAIDFTSPDAVMTNVPALARRGINVVLGTTGWQAREGELRSIVEGAGTGIVAAPNFSTGVVLFEALVARAAALFAGQPDYGAWLYEAHHAMKKDAPSGTAITLKRTMERAGYDRPIDVAASRAGFIPGTHTIGFDGPSESITLTHTARDRGAFARGALTAAQWVKGRHGWFTMQDVLGLKEGL
jgi:4-hydroxy-tetrahydrodipicolinate reductase